jgi:hypothetical protein
LLVAGVILVTRFLPGRTRQGSLSRGERIYVFSTPAPLVLSFILPDLVGLHFLYGGALSAGQKSWSNGILIAGLVASGALVIAGLVLLWRRWMDGRGVDGRLFDGMLLASVPLVLVMLVAGLWWSASR